MTDSHESPLADIRHEVSFRLTERGFHQGTCSCGYRSPVARSKPDAIRDMIDHVSRSLMWHGLALASIVLEIGYPHE